MASVSRRQALIRTAAAAASADWLSALLPKLHAYPLDMPAGCRTYPVRALIAEDFPGTHDLLFSGCRRMSDLPIHQCQHCMEAQTPTLSSRAKPRDLLCAFTPNKGHLRFATSRRVSCLGRTNRLVKTCELTRRAFVWRQGAQQVPRLRPG